MYARDIWIHRLAYLELMHSESQQSRYSKFYKFRGTGHWKNAQAQLRNEREELLKILGRWGLDIDADEVVATIGRLVLMDNLEDDYLMLSNLYRDASRVAEQWEDSVAAEWLLGRANIRRQQHFLLLRC